MVRAVFFDIAGTLGSLAYSSSRDRIERLLVYAYIPAVLEELRPIARLGILADLGSTTNAEGNAVLSRAGIAGFFDTGLRIFERGKGADSFAVAAQKFGCSPEECMFVCDDAWARTLALSVGFRVSPHPFLIRELLGGAQLIYVRITTPAGVSDNAWPATLLQHRLVPLHRTGKNGSVVFGMATTSAAAQLDDSGFDVTRLGQPDDPLNTNLYRLRDDRQSDSGFLDPRGNSTQLFSARGDARFVLASSQEGLYVALPSDRSIEQYHFLEAQHGHTQKLIADLNLLEPSGRGGYHAPTSLTTPVEREAALAKTEIAALQGITREAIQGYVERLTGRASIEGRLIESRHIQHPHNAWITEALLRILEEIGAGDYKVTAHRFLHEGLELHNIEAELAGSDSSEIVLVTAHFDSTAANSPSYDPETDLAPGTDDDASGVAAVLAIATVFKSLSLVRRPKRTVRFLLFNAEEHGLVGSRSYARDQAAIGAPIAAVFQMDMIGYNLVAPPIFEIHAGFSPSEAVQHRSVILAERIARAVQTVSPGLSSPQIYVSRGSSPEEQDPAEGRSDHASFQLVGYPGCCTSEDFFMGPNADSPASEPNPNYHKASDTEVDAQYAADIARAVAAAAWLTANLDTVSTPAALEP